MRTSFAKFYFFIFEKCANVFLCRCEIFCQIFFAGVWRHFDHFVDFYYVIAKAGHIISNKLDWRVLCLQNPTQLGEIQAIFAFVG